MTDLASLTSLILSALVADDALTASELCALLGVPARELRPALLELEAAGALVTSGRTSGTRYCLSVEEALVEEEVIPSCAASMGCLCAGHARGNPATDACDTRELPTPTRTRTRRPRTARAPQQPATLDLLAALTETAALVADGVSLQAMRSIALDRRAGGMAG